MDYDQIFQEAGLARGRHFGSKSGYLRNNPVSVFIPNAFVCDAERKIWGGDLDLLTADSSRLLAVGGRLGFPLYVMREQFYQLTPDVIKMYAEAVVEGGAVKLSPSLLRCLSADAQTQD